MRTILLLILGLAGLNAWSEEYPQQSKAEDYIDVEEERERLGAIDGTWIGTLAPLHDPNGVSRDFPAGYPIQMSIGGETAELAFIEEGGRIDPLPQEAILVFAENGTALVLYVAATESFTEVWSISLNQVAEDTIKAFISRTVHNVAIRRDSPWRVFPLFSEVEFKRRK